MAILRPSCHADPAPRHARPRLDRGRAVPLPAALAGIAARALRPAVRRGLRRCAVPQVRPVVQPAGAAPAGPQDRPHHARVRLRDRRQSLPRRTCRAGRRGTDRDHPDRGGRAALRGGGPCGHRSAGDRLDRIAGHRGVPAGQPRGAGAGLRPARRAPVAGRAAHRGRRRIRQRGAGGGGMVRRQRGRHDRPHGHRHHALARRPVGTRQVRLQDHPVHGLRPAGGRLDGGREPRHRAARRKWLPR